MLSETGRIIDIKISNGDKIAIVECVSKSACKSCNNNDTCGIGVVAKGYSDKSHHIVMPYKEGMDVNDTIELLINQQDVVKSSLIAYFVPLIAFVLGALISHLFFNNELVIIFTSLLSLFIGIYLSKVLSTWLYPNGSLNKLISTR